MVDQRLKQLLLVVIAMTLECKSVLATPISESNKSAEGRFLLLEGTYDPFLGKGPSEHAVFRIDTSTGQVWKYAPGWVDGEGTAHMEYWFPIPEDEKIYKKAIPTP